jgi:calcium binding protein 39
MFGEDEGHPNKENALLITREACRQELISEMVESLQMLDFESRKDVGQILCAMIRIEDRGAYPGLDYLLSHPDVVPLLFAGYDRPELALNCGSMFRECVRHAPVAADFLKSELFAELFDKLSAAEFEIASDAFLTFKDLLTRHRAVVADYLAEHNDHFMGLYHALLTSPNYVTRRQAVKLLGELLLDRHNTRTMMTYVADVGNLQLMMNLLKDSSKSIQFEAFHVFKVFVANPHKTRPVVDVLLNNRDKLLAYLEGFQTERGEARGQRGRVGPLAGRAAVAWRRRGEGGTASAARMGARAARLAAEWT